MRRLSALAGLLVAATLPACTGFGIASDAPGWVRAPFLGTTLHWTGAGVNVVAHEPESESDGVALSLSTDVAGVSTVTVEAEGAARGSQVATWTAGSGNLRDARPVLAGEPVVFGLPSREDYDRLGRRRPRDDDPPELRAPPIPERIVLRLPAQDAPPGDAAAPEGSPPARRVDCDLRIESPVGTATCPVHLTIRRENRTARAALRIALLAGLAAAIVHNPPAFSGPSFSGWNMDLSGMKVPARF